MERLTLRPCKTDSQGARLVCCAGGPGLPEGCGQVGQALSANDCFPPAAFSDSSCWAFCWRPEETLEYQIRKRTDKQKRQRTKKHRLPVQTGLLVKLVGSCQEWQPMLTNPSMTFSAWLPDTSAQRLFILSWNHLRSHKWIEEYYFICKSFSDVSFKCKCLLRAGSEWW